MYIFDKQPRLLYPSEWYRLAPFAQEFGGSIPDPASAQVLVVEEGTAIIAFATLEPIMHIGPVWVDPARRSLGLFQRLTQAAYRHLPTTMRGGVCFTEHSVGKRLIARLGLKEITRRCFIWEKHHG